MELDLTTLEDLIKATLLIKEINGNYEKFIKLHVENFDLIQSTVEKNRVLIFTSNRIPNNEESKLPPKPSNQNHPLTKIQNSPNQPSPCSSKPPNPDLFPAPLNQSTESKPPSSSNPSPNIPEIKPSEPKPVLQVKQPEPDPKLTSKKPAFMLKNTFSEPIVKKVDPSKITVKCANAIESFDSGSSDYDLDDESEDKDLEETFDPRKLKRRRIRMRMRAMRDFHRMHSLHHFHMGQRFIARESNQRSDDSEEESPIYMHAPMMHGNRNPAPYKPVSLSRNQARGGMERGNHGHLTPSSNNRGGWADRQVNRGGRASRGRIQMPVRHSSDEEEMKYEDLVELDYQLFEKGNGFDPKVIMNLKKIPFSGDIKIKICAICQSDFFMKEPVTVLACKHIFHHECIYDWLLRKKRCPLNCVLNKDDF